MTTTTTDRKCRLCGTADMPDDERALYCEVNGCNDLPGEAYKAVHQLAAAQKLAMHLGALGAKSWEVAQLPYFGRLMAEQACGLGQRSDVTWALVVALLRGDLE